MCKQHLNAFSVMARSLESFNLGQRASNVTSLLVAIDLQLQNSQDFDSQNEGLWNGTGGSNRVGRPGEPSPRTHRSETNWRCHWQPGKDYRSFC